MNKIIKNTIILTIITVVAGLGLGFVYEITKDPIAAAQEATKKEAWQAVFPEASLDDFAAAEVNSDLAAEVVAGLGIGTLVVEGGYRSGTSVTARYTEELGKKVERLQADYQLLENKFKKFKTNKRIEFTELMGDFKEEFEQAKSEYERTTVVHTYQDRLDKIIGDFDFERD